MNGSIIAKLRAGFSALPMRASLPAWRIESTSIGELESRRARAQLALSVIEGEILSGNS